ncbi:hypothetical protein JOB18_018837 [Solea senegalensis]|uniref:Uncharacterized protein n=1 Tax=Solea senegalensis TaxID=28829 RepID=A0AAV6Q5A4_SOLSE|nr:hypothetical protein JOB18_018837 [Solea senegalensis]
MKQDCLELSDEAEIITTVVTVKRPALQDTFNPPGAEERRKNPLCQDSRLRASRVCPSNCPFHCEWIRGDS